MGGEGTLASPVFGVRDTDGGRRYGLSLNVTILKSVEMSKGEHAYDESCTG